MEIEKLYEVQGVFLTEAAIKTLKKLQLHGNAELKDEVKFLDETFSYLISQMGDSLDEKTKELSSLSTRLNALKKKFKTLSKP